MAGLAIGAIANGTVVKSYHRFWSFLLGGGAIALGLIPPMFAGA